MKHAKGPWRIDSKPDRSLIGILGPMDIEDDPNPVAAVNLRREEWASNADLIILALTAPHDCDLDCPGAVNKAKLEALPEMLEALEAAEQHYAMLCEVICTDNPPPGGHPVLLRLRAVIAKAKGE